MMWLLLLPLAVASGVLGRMGGATGYDTKYRDVGCSALFVLFSWLCFWQFADFWWVYLLVFALMWGGLSTYWDEIWGYDNMWFSGFTVGLAAFPLAIIDWTAFFFLIPRAVCLALIWWALNKHLPQKVWKWNRDVAEEFLRYFFTL